MFLLIFGEGFGSDEGEHWIVEQLHGQEIGEEPSLNDLSISLID